MNRPFRLLFSALFTLSLTAFPPPAPAEGTSPLIAWQNWAPDLFTRARSDNKLVILDLEAVWCHWCHVMDNTTYSNPAVAKILRDGYIAVKVDQDSRPDISNRYEDYGWPATIIFDSKGKELAKLSGYIPPEQLTSILTAFLEDPTPGPSANAAPPHRGPRLSGDESTRQLEQLVIDRYDKKNRGWGFVHKYLDPDNVEYTLDRAAAGDKQSAQMARETLDANRALIDPVWGGVYQYSVGGRWNEPHFEKIMYYQTANLRSYAYAYSLWKRKADLETARAIRRYLKDFLESPDGAFYTSQDADLIQGQHSASYFKLSDKERRKRGIPRIDDHRYARENGWAIEALCVYAAASGDESAVEEAGRAADWIVKNRSLPGGGFRHDERDPAGPYLGDTLAMARAFLALYQVTGERRWLDRAQQSAAFMEQFKDPSGGYVTAKVNDDQFASVPQRDENIALARFANLLSKITGKADQRAMADHAMKFLTAEDQAERNPAGVLIALDELKNDPPHVTVVGSKKNPAARELFKTAVETGVRGYRRVEWWDPAEGSPVNADVQYPELEKPAAFLCANGACSLPFYDARTLQKKIVENVGG